MYKYYNRNPRNRNIEDCVIRSLSLLTNRSWEDVYKELSIYYPNIKPAQMRKHIVYALQHRDYDKAEDNFEEIFGFEHDEYYFEPKVFMEEVANIIRIESI